MAASSSGSEKPRDWREGRVLGGEGKGEGRGGSDAAAAAPATGAAALPTLAPSLLALTQPPSLLSPHLPTRPLLLSPHPPNGFTPPPPPPRRYNYPAQRRAKDRDGAEKGVVGSVTQLQRGTFSTQPISSFDWSADKEGLAVMGVLDQSFRVILCTKLAKV